MLVRYLPVPVPGFQQTGAAGNNALSRLGGAGLCSWPYKHPLRTLNPPLLSGMARESLQQQRHALNCGLNYMRALQAQVVHHFTL